MARLALFFGLLCAVRAVLGFVPAPPRQRTMTTVMSSRGVNSRKSAGPSEPLVIPPDYKVPAGFIATGLGLSTVGGNPGAGLPLALIGAFLAARAQKVRFVFDKDSMEVLTVGDKGELQNSGENFAVGGRNRWTYSSFTNWEFYPSAAFPILVYFKETQTKAEGQIHFFPVIMDGGELYTSFKRFIPLPGK